MPNALARETSPYLRQHAGNPVDWLPWGPEALALARQRDVPLLVSIGYSSCHWCHVMEHESFEDPATAAVMNEEFVCVKVDREERPDIDALYMEAVQGMTGHGGWPLNVFLTPEQVPFYGGTYFPPQARPGMPAWTQVLQAIAETWREQADQIRAGGERLLAQLGGGALLSPSEAPFQATLLDSAVENLRGSFDALHGGFGGSPTQAPKFPQASVLEFLLAHGEYDMARFTLGAMASGGIHDQIGGGFHRYAVDATWTVPHFEKMLYDNALLARVYLHAYRVSTEEPTLLHAPASDPPLDDADHFALVCRDTLDWVLREMQGPEGGFYSALDADSEGVEGRYYVWTVAELREVLGENDDLAAAIDWLGATEEGNFLDGVGGSQSSQPGWNVLEDRGGTQPGGLGRPARDVRERIRARLLAARERRVRPGLDDKRLTSWNALTIAALADAGSVLDEPRYLDAAERCARFVLRELRDERGRLLRTYSDGRARLGAYLEDYAFLLEALLTLFEATCEGHWLDEARTLADEIVARFADPEHGGFFSTASDAETLIVRRKDLEDSPIPSGSSSAALGLLRLARLTGEQSYEDRAVGALRLVHEIAPRHPTAFGHVLQAMQLYLFPEPGPACAVPPARGRATPDSSR